MITRREFARVPPAVAFSIAVLGVAQLPPFAESALLRPFRQPI